MQRKTRVKELFETVTDKLLVCCFICGRTVGMKETVLEVHNSNDGLRCTGSNKTQGETMRTWEIIERRFED